MSVNAEQVVAWLRRCADAVATRKGYLIELDSAIGDGDHGENLDRGFQAVLAKLDGPAPDTPAEAFKVAASTLISTVGGASGPLFGTAFLRASGAVTDQPELDPAAIVAVLAAARDGVVARGKAERGEKTMLDGLAPAVDAAENSHATGGDVPAVLSAAADAADEGATATTPLIARKGRASYLAERSAGHRDPGATSVALLLRAAAQTEA